MTEYVHFQDKVWQYYEQSGRSMPWREKHDLYSVLVSELMLQQTQVQRVVPKFESFMKRFPTLASLAQASLADVLIEWQGLGYNRRAKFLHQAVQHIVEHGEPASLYDLEQLPGVGRNTAAAIMAYVHNEPVAFIETNIRTVYIHEFFPDATEVADSQIVELVMQTVDRKNPREWYWALMDYGTHLKAQRLGSIRKSAHYKRQSTFKGSLREMRGMIVRHLRKGPTDIDVMDEQQDERFIGALEGLIKDGLVERHGSVICLTAHSEQS